MRMRFKRDGPASAGLTDFLNWRKTKSDTLKRVLLKTKTQLPLGIRRTPRIEGANAEAVFLAERGYPSGNFLAIGFGRISRM